MRVQIKELTLAFKDEEIGLKVQQLIVSGGFPTYLKNLLEKDLGPSQDNDAMMQSIMAMLRNNSGNPINEEVKHLGGATHATYVDTSDFSLDDIDDDSDDLLDNKISSERSADFADRIRRMNN